MRRLWLDELLQTQKEDCDFLLHLLRNERFGQEPLILEETTAEGVLRACSAVRLKLRHGALAKIPDHQLETGEMGFEDLPPPARPAFLCYLVLAGLQTFIIHALDPASAEPPPDEDFTLEEE